MRRSLQQALTHSAFAIALSALALPAFSQAQPAPRSPHQGPPVARDDAEKNILALLDSADRYLSVPREDGRLLRVLTEAVDAKHVVEIGTSVG